VTGTWPWSSPVTLAVLLFIFWYLQYHYGFMSSILLH
jgi:hypothetical protein